MRDMRRVYKVLVGRTEGTRPLERPRRRWEDNIKWIFSKWDREASTGLIWLRIGTGGWRRSVFFFKCGKASEEEACSTELVS
jgi:hypothetical protein